MEGRARRRRSSMRSLQAQYVCACCYVCVCVGVQHHAVTCNRLALRACAHQAPPMVTVELLVLVICYQKCQNMLLSVEGIFLLQHANEFAVHVSSIERLETGRLCATNRAVKAEAAKRRACA